MANVFFRQNRQDVADSLYTRVTDIWHEHLLRIVTSQTKRPETSAVGGAVVELEEKETESLGRPQPQVTETISMACNIKHFE